jgi:hypothetical protein
MNATDPRFARCGDGRIAVKEFADVESHVLGYIAETGGGKYLAENLLGEREGGNEFDTAYDAARFLDELPRRN